MYSRRLGANVAEIYTGQIPGTHQPVKGRTHIAALCEHTHATGIALHAGGFEDGGKRGERTRIQVGQAHSLRTRYLHAAFPSNLYQYHLVPPTICELLH